MGNVINITPQEASCDEILELCKGKYADLLVLGWDEDDNLTARASNSLGNPELLYIVELFKLAILNANVEGLDYE